MIVGCMLMNMRRSIPFLLVSLLLIQSVLSMAVENVEATSGRGGTTGGFSVDEI